MLRKLQSFFIIGATLLISNSISFTQTRTDWSAVENVVNQEVAIKTNSGKTSYGVIKSADSNGLVLQIAGDKSMSQNEESISRTDVNKVWRTLLFVNNRNTAKGALIGAGVGAGIGAGVGLAGLGSTGGSDETGLILGSSIFLGAASGAVIGAVGGFFQKTNHKKRDLIYKK